MADHGQLLDSRQIHDGRVVDLRLDTVRMPNGERAELEVVRHVGAAAVVPVTADGEALLIRQYRHAPGAWLLEVPAGKLDGGEAPELCAARELEEEVGVRAGRLEPLGWIWTTPGFTDEKIWLYLALGLEASRQRLERDEIIEVVRMPFAEALSRVADGTFRDAKSLCALFLAARHPALPGT